jgi:3'-phosphoadenosine 5'-phosphosulfate sulfotransferase (PAPS reductase)/FAD synthetase
MLKDRPRKKRTTNYLIRQKRNEALLAEKDQRIAKGEVKMIEYMACVSGGNDSIAEIQFLLNEGKTFSCVYNDTGWAKDNWKIRVDQMGCFCESNGITLYVTESVGMEALVRQRKGWPMPASAMQFCTGELKEKPTIKLLDDLDPDKELIVVTGRRREESQNRADLAQYQDESVKHGGRDVWNPLYLHTESDRDELIKQAGFEILPHSSRECWPCVCENKKGLKLLASDPARIDLIEVIEIDMGHTRNDKPRTMFRPYRVGGAVGIRQSVRWGCGKHGWKAPFYPNEYRVKYTQLCFNEGVSDIAYDIDTPEGREFARQCDGGYCGS